MESKINKNDVEIDEYDSAKRMNNGEDLESMHAHKLITYGWLAKIRKTLVVWDVESMHLKVWNCSMVEATIESLAIQDTWYASKEYEKSSFDIEIPWGI